MDVSSVNEVSSRSLGAREKSRGNGSGESNKLTAVGLFAGIGGLELGFRDAGIQTELLCELDVAAQSSLRKAFPEVAIEADVKHIRSLPSVDVVAGGFPCQNLSLVGTNEGIFGDQSGLVRELFRLVSKRRGGPRWVVLENVPFMLWHKKGHAVQYVTQQLESLGFRWAYRVVDSRAFGLPQRRRRVLIVASRQDDPRAVLYADDAGHRIWEDDGEVPCGFYWTEGRGGLGWAIDCVPTLKGGSAIGIPSPPAIWHRQLRRLVTPDIRDAERLQGFDHDWTDVSSDERPIRVGHRWKMVGNAVTVPVAGWLGSRLVAPDYSARFESSKWESGVWPDAAWGERGEVHKVHISEFPVHRRFVGLRKFLKFPLKDLSAKATAGFLKRAKSGKLRFSPGFLEAAERHLRVQEQLEDGSLRRPLATCKSAERKRAAQVRSA